MKSRALQQHFLKVALSFVAGWKHAEQWVPLQAVWKVKYDETPLRMRVRFLTGSGHGKKTKSFDEQDQQVSKLFVHECSWSLLLQPGKRALASESDCLVIKGSFAPECRIVDRATAPGIAAVVASCHSPPSEIKDLFPHTIRLVESDSLSANAKSERLLQESVCWRKWQRYTIHCMAHRIHSSTTRTFSLAFMKPLITGLKNMLLFMRSPGVISEFRAHIKTVVQDKLLVIQGRPEISLHVRDYKEKMLDAFLPERASGQVVVVYAALIMFNGDWLTPASQQIEHYCRGCCRSRQDTVQKCIFLLNRMLSCCRPQIFSAGNWKSWQKSFAFIGVFGAIHNVLFEILRRTLHSITSKTSASDAHERLLLGGVQAHDEGDRGFHWHDVHADAGAVSGNNEARAMDDGEYARWREQESEKRDKTKDLLALPFAVERSFAVLRALAPETKLMATVLEADSGLWEITKMAKLLRGGVRQHRLHVLSEAAQVAMREWGGLLCSPMSPWDHLTPSSTLSQSIQISLLHAAAVVYESVVIPRQAWSWRIFDIISDASVAESLISEPQCLLDDFVQYFCATFATLEEMQGA